MVLKLVFVCGVGQAKVERRGEVALYLCTDSSKSPLKITLEVNELYLLFLVGGSEEIPEPY